jgi:hypothetical protein
MKSSNRRHAAVITVWKSSRGRGGVLVQGLGKGKGDRGKKLDDGDNWSFCSRTMTDERGGSGMACGEAKGGF